MGNIPNAIICVGALARTPAGFYSLYTPGPIYMQVAQPHL